MALLEDSPHNPNYSTSSHLPDSLDTTHTITHHPSSTGLSTGFIKIPFILLPDFNQAPEICLLDPPAALDSSFKNHVIKHTKKLDKKSKKNSLRNFAISIFFCNFVMQLGH